MLIDYEKELHFKNLHTLVMYWWPNSEGWKQSMLLYQSNRELILWFKLFDVNLRIYLNALTGKLETSMLAGENITPKESVWRDLYFS